MGQGPCSHHGKGYVGLEPSSDIDDDLFLVCAVISIVAMYLKLRSIVLF